MTEPKRTSKRQRPSFNGQAADPIGDSGSAWATSSWPSSKVGMRKVSELVPYARNARTHSSDQVTQIARLIQEFGWTTPILIRAETSAVIAVNRPGFVGGSNS
jgi:hypothetical protein